MTEDPVLKPDLFVSAGRLQEHRPQPPFFLGLSPNEDVFCSSKPKHDKSTAARIMIGV
jgi:hypothetical protein